MRPVARGRTLRIERIVERGDAARIIAELGDGFTGRILGTLVYNSKPFDVVMLVEKGSITAAALNSQKTSPDELVNLLLEADDGFLELQELDEAGLSLDKEFNTDFVLDEPIGLQALKPPEKQEAVKEEPREAEEKAEETEAEKGEHSVEASVATIEETPAQVEAQVETEAPPSPEERAEREMEETVEPGMGAEVPGETIAEAEVDTTSGAIEEPATVEEEPSRSIEAGPEAAAEGEPGGEIGASTVTVEEQRPVLPEATVSSVEETIPVRGKGSLEEILHELRKYVNSNAIDKCSEKLEANIVNAYLAMVKAEKLLRRMKPSQLLDDITEIVQRTRDQEDYIRVVVNLGEPDTNAARYDLILLMLQGSIIAALLVDHNNPLEVLLSGRHVFEKVPEEVSRCHVLGGIAHVVSRQAIEPLLGCSQYAQQREKRERRRGFLSRLFGR